MLRRHFSDANASLKRAWQRGAMGDLKEMQATGGKLFIASQQAIPVKDAKFVPDFRGICLSSNRMSMRQVCKGNVTLLTVASNVLAEEMVKKWTAAVEQDALLSKNLNIFHFRFVDSWIKYPFLPLMSLFSYFRISNPKMFMNYYGRVDWILEELEVVNRINGYIFLVDHVGSVRWRACGAPQPQEIESMASISKGLLEEKTK